MWYFVCNMIIVLFNYPISFSFPSSTSGHWNARQRERFNNFWSLVDLLVRLEPRWSSNLSHLEWAVLGKKKKVINYIVCLLWESLGESGILGFFFFFFFLYGFFGCYVLGLSLESEKIWGKVGFGFLYGLFGCYGFGFANVLLKGLWMVLYGPVQGFMALMTIDSELLYRRSWHVCVLCGPWHGA